MLVGHGVNVGHGYVKYRVILEDGTALDAVVLPSLIAPAENPVAGGLDRIKTVMVGEGSATSWWWVGENALHSASARTMLTQERLTDPVFIPALVRGAAAQLAEGGRTSGVCVTGLPASWATDTEKCRQLGDRLREAVPYYSKIRVIPEPLGLVYAFLLDENGEVSVSGMDQGTVGVVDLGHHTVDVAVIRALKVMPSSLMTFDQGTARPLREIRSLLGARFEIDLTLYETDQAVRWQALRIAGQEQALPTGWDRPLLLNAELIASRLVELWGKGAQLDAVLLGGGGAELEPIVTAIQRRFPQAIVVPEPQLAIAQGYANFARRLAGEQAMQAAR